MKIDTKLTTVALAAAFITSTASAEIVSWEASKQAVTAVGAADLSEVEAQITNLTTYIANEQQYQATLNGAKDANDIQIGLDQANLDSATTSAASAATALTDANAALASAQTALDNIVDATSPEYAEALQARDDAQTAVDAATILNTNAQTALVQAQTSLNASTARKSAIEGARDRSEDRVTAAQDAQTTIQNAIDAKNASFEGINTALTQYGEGIYGTDGVNNLDGIISTLDAVVADDDGINDPVAPATLPQADTGADLSTAYLNDETNDPIAVDAYIAEANAALDSVTAPITAAEKTDLLNTIGNGAFERQAVTETAEGLVEFAGQVEAYAGQVDAQLQTLNGDATVDGSVDSKIAAALNADSLGENEVGIAGTITRNTETGEVHIGENSLITAEVGGVQQLYAQDAGANPIDIDVTNGSNLLINGDAVATQVYADQADTALGIRIDDEEAARIAEDTAIRGEFAAADTALDTAIRNDFAAADDVVRGQFAAEDTAIRGEFAAADTALDTAIRNDFAAADDVVRGEFAAADTALGIRIDAEEADRIAEDIAIRGEFAAADTALDTAIRNDFAAADDVVRGEFAAADTALGIRIDAEEADRIAEDTAIRGEFAAADTALDTAIRNDFAAADTALGIRIDAEEADRIAEDIAIRGEFAAADAAIRSDFASADANLQRQISSNREDIDRNTRGIAMVAALTHTTVLPGMTHALDVSAAHFEGETGMALSYSRRIKEGVQINFGAASTDDFEESVVRGGIGFQW